MFYYDNTFSDEYFKRFTLQLFDQFTHETVYPVHIDFNLVDYSYKDIVEELAFLGIDIKIHPVKITKDLPKSADNPFLLLGHLITCVINSGRNIQCSYLPINGNLYIRIN